MANTQGFDKVNILKRRSLPYPEYFGTMDLTDEQKKKREALAFEIEDAIMLFFMLFESEREAGILNESVVKQELTYSIYDIINDSKEQYFDSEEETEKYVVDLVDETYRNTAENIEKTPNDYDYTGETQYWVSPDRAQFIAENEANTLYNSSDFVEAKKSGKTHKIWMSYGDERVRLTHQEVDGAKIPIDAYFDVGRARMLYPKDTTSELSTGAECPEEVINCRCSCKYI